jgi:L,D-peptidoglycan transpeptidase YkuD (ErfK/YbiS/YcfS/YnhG family)
VDGLKDKTLRAKLQKMITVASNQLKTQNEAVKTVYSLFSDQTSTILAGTVNRELFNQAKQTAGKIGNEKKKNELNELLAKADILLTNAEKIQAEAKAKEEALKKQASDSAQAQVNANKQNAGSANSSGTIQATGQQETGFARIVANSKTSQRTDQIVTVVASGATAKITLWEKANNIWTQIITSSGFVGSQGIGQASEGSKRTPKGSYSLGFAFGQSNPGTLLPFRQITPNSYWISDVNSNLYNTWQEGPYAGNGNEHLADYANLQYYYAIVINYNMNAVKGAGSAFFLHVSNGRPTAGCVSVPKNVMELLMKRIHTGACIINVTSENEVSNY